jgi:hypothetical protein
MAWTTGSRLSTGDDPAVAGVRKKAVPEFDPAISEQGARAAQCFKFSENTTRDGFDLFAGTGQDIGWAAKAQGVPPV